MQDDDIKRIVQETVQETLKGFGITAQEQHEVQADFLYIRQMRKGSEALGRNIKNSIVTILVPTFIYMAWETVKSKLGK